MSPIPNPQAPRKSNTAQAVLCLRPRASARTIQKEQIPTHACLSPEQRLGEHCGKEYIDILVKTSLCYSKQRRSIITDGPPSFATLRLHYYLLANVIKLDYVAKLQISQRLCNTHFRVILFPLHSFFLQEFLKLMVVAIEFIDIYSMV